MSPKDMSQDHAVAQRRRARIYRDLGGKYMFDRIGAALLLLVFAPLVAILWLIVRRGGGAGFYSQSRIGYGGTVFQCWKIRSMHPDADALLASHLEADPVARAQWDAGRKLVCDPRVTRLGAVLRRYSLDELPQLWNVFRGDMSLVGPRPVPEEELVLYGVEGRRAYHSVRPGITGLWQVSGRNGISYEKRVALDIDYCENIYFMRDVLILAKTIFVVIQPTGV